MPIVKRIRYPCKKCGKMFPRTGRACRVCDDCHKKIHKRIIRVRRR